MAEIIWSPRAIKDIDEIASYIAKDSLQYAEAQTKLFFSMAEVLEIYPLSYQMSCPYDYPDPVDRRAGRTSISNQHVGVMVDEVAGVNEPIARGR